MILGCIISFAGGALFGILVMCLCAVSRDSEKGDDE